MTDLIAELRAVLSQTIQHYTKRPDDRCPFCAAKASANRHDDDCRLDRVMRATAPAAPKAPERGARAHICEIHGCEWQLRYEAGSSIGYCPKCCPDDEAKRLAASPIQICPGCNCVFPVGGAHSCPTHSFGEPNREAGGDEP